LDFLFLLASGVDELMRFVNLVANNKVFLKDISVIDFFPKIVQQNYVDLRLI
jgi:hypothetical protein